MTLFRGFPSRVEKIQQALIVALLNFPLLPSSNPSDNRHPVTLGYFNANKTPRGYRGGPPIRYNDAASIIIPSGQVLRDSTNSVDMVTTGNLTVSLASSGANGLDTGAEASNTWYYVYLIMKTDGTTAGLLSTVNEFVTGSVTMPAGYTYKRQYKLAIRNDGSSNQIPFLITDAWPNAPRVIWNVAQAAGAATVGPTNVLDGGTQTSYTDIDLSSYMPAGITTLATVRGQHAAITSDVTWYLRKNGASSDMYSRHHDNDRYASEIIDIETDSSGIIEYKLSSAGALDVSVWGYVVNVGAA